MVIDRFYSCELAALSHSCFAPGHGPRWRRERDHRRIWQTGGCDPREPQPTPGVLRRSFRRSAKVRSCLNLKWASSKILVWMLKVIFFFDEKKSIVSVFIFYFLKFNKFEIWNFQRISNFKFQIRPSSKATKRQSQTRTRASLRTGIDRHRPRSTCCRCRATSCSTPRRLPAWVLARAREANSRMREFLVQHSEERPQEEVILRRRSRSGHHSCFLALAAMPRDGLGGSAAGAAKGDRTAVFWSRRPAEWHRRHGPMAQFCSSLEVGEIPIQAHVGLKKGSFAARAVSGLASPGATRGLLAAHDLLAAANCAWGPTNILEASSTAYAYVGWLFLPFLFFHVRFRLRDP